MTPNHRQEKQSANKRLKQPVTVTLWADLWSGEKLGAFYFLTFHLLGKRSQKGRPWSLPVDKPEGESEGLLWELK
jgi:hypothetical protein